MGKPVIGVFGLTSCAGDQLAIVNCEDELLAIAGAVDIKCFHMAQSNNDEDTHYDVAFVEGTVVTEEDEERLKHIRANSGLLVALGSCAAFGGIPGAANDFKEDYLWNTVYGKKVEEFGRKTASPLEDFVDVDLVIPGCPVEKSDLLNGVASLLHGDVPLITNSPVCVECKMKENACLLLKGKLCLGPVSRGGCDARCPTHGIECRGCRGPVEDANIGSELSILVENGYEKGDVARAMATFAREVELYKIIDARETAASKSKPGKTEEGVV